jgi:TetR/AcrR family transcriptional regulator, regulator of autoinduction and epiphytic fitness
MNGADGGGPVDGRAARAQRTRDAIVSACTALLLEGDLRPTAPRIAERAGVSVRSVFMHFEDLEQLFTAVADRFFARTSRQVASIDPDAPLERRVGDFVAERARLLEVVTPMRRAANVHAPTSMVLTSRLRMAQDFLRGEVARTFAPELSSRDDGDRAQLLDALDATLSWSSWDTLRSIMGRPPDAAKSVLERAVLALLA